MPPVSPARRPPGAQQTSAPQGSSSPSNANRPAQTQANDPSSRPSRTQDGFDPPPSRPSRPLPVINQQQAQNRPDPAPGSTGSPRPSGSAPSPSQPGSPSSPSPSGSPQPGQTREPGWRQNEREPGKYERNTREWQTERGFGNQPDQQQPPGKVKTEVSVGVKKDLWNKEAKVWGDKWQAGEGKPFSAAAEVKTLGASTKGTGRLDQNGASIKAEADAYLLKTEGTAGAKYKGGETSVKGEVFVGAKAEGNAGAGKLDDGRWGAKVGGQAFAGAEANVELTQRVGPVKATPKVGVKAGIGAQADADIGFGNGHLSGNFRAGAAIGLGAEAGVKFDVDVVGAAKDVAGGASKAWHAVTPW